MTVRNWVKHALPYAVTCAVARGLNPPFLADIQRCERLQEYAWVLGQVGQHHPVGGPLLDFGYAGSYFAEALCQFGAVVGVDLRHTPRIRHPWFAPQTTLDAAGGPYATIVCVSVLEHYLDVRAWVARLFASLRPGGQLLLTYPTTLDAPKRFRGYQELSVPWGALGYLVNGHEVFLRTGGGWLPYGVAARAQWLGPNTEHRVTTLACVRLVRLERESPDAAALVAGPDSAARPPATAPGDTRG